MEIDTEKETKILYHKTTYTFDSLKDLLEENALLKDQLLNKELKVGKRYVKTYS